MAYLESLEDPALAGGDAAKFCCALIRLCGRIAMNKALENELLGVAVKRRLPIGGVALMEFPRLRELPGDKVPWAKDSQTNIDEDIRNYRDFPPEDRHLLHLASAFDVHIVVTGELPRRGKVWIPYGQMELGLRRGGVRGLEVLGPFEAMGRLVIGSN